MPNMIESVRIAGFRSLADVQIEFPPGATVLIGANGFGAGGGNVGIERLAADTAKLYFAFDAVTSLVDFYGFRDKGNNTADELQERLLEEFERRVGCEVDRSKVIPYVQQHEFKGLFAVLEGGIRSRRGCA